MSKVKTFPFQQRCLKCSHVLKLHEPQTEKTLTKPKTYVCEVLDEDGKKIAGCGHKGVFGEQTTPPPAISISNNTLPEETIPVFDNDNNPCLTVNGKRYPFTLGRIMLLKKEITQKMSQLDNLEGVWAKEQDNININEAGDKK